MNSRAAVAFASFLALTGVSSPALAKDKDKATAKEPVETTADTQLAGPTNTVVYVVPAGKRLVVEHFSSEVGLSATTQVNRFALVVAPDPNTPGHGRFLHFLPPSFSSSCGTCSSGQAEVVASQAVRMYVEAGEALVVNITFSGEVGPNAFASYSVSGHLVDVP
jgi:hypothetical protein